MEAESKELEVVATPPTDSLALAREPSIVLNEAKRAAAALKDVISKKAKPVIFNGEQYLEFEDWQTVGRFYGVTAKEDGDPEPVDIDGVVGFKASAVALRADGQVISRATAYCMKEEPNWRNKPIYQLASMAQTRACSKALRNCLAWVVVLAGYKATPADEMPREERRVEPEVVEAPHGVCPKHSQPWIISPKTGKKGHLNPTCTLGAVLFAEFAKTADAAGADAEQYLANHVGPWDKAHEAKWFAAVQWAKDQLNEKLGQDELPDVR